MERLAPQCSRTTETYTYLSVKGVNNIVRPFDNLNL
jgi:hypothetical protein